MKQQEFTFMMELLTPSELMTNLMGEQFKKDWDECFLKVIQSMEL